MQLTKPVTTVYVSNMSEDVWPFISAMSDSQQRQLEINENADLSDRDLLAFSGHDHTILILPEEINSDFLEYFHDLFNTKDLKILTPKIHTGEVCLDTLKDKDLIDQLVTAANSSRKLNLLSYSTSPQFLDLCRHLRSLGLTIYTPESPEEPDAWTVNFYGSKSGIRQLTQQGNAEEPDLQMPKGLITTNIADAAKIAAKLYIKEEGVVLKTNKGHSGAGILIFRPGDLPTNYFDCEVEILKKLKREEYWSKFPIIVERFVIINPTIAGGFPNVEFKIWKSGKVEYLYSGGMRVTKDGIFNGMEIGSDVLSDKLSAQLVDTGFYVGEQLASDGYRGYFDIDFLTARNGDILVSESNVRRTGATHVYHTALSLFGDDYEYQTYILSNNVYALPKQKSFTFTQIQKILEPILFNKDTKEGIVLAAANVLKHHLLSYIIFGTNEKRALALEEEMKRLLGN